MAVKDFMTRKVVYIIQIQQYHAADLMRETKGCTAYLLSKMIN